jgi:pimeloyl-ACP methyl ester carboxylesterase
MNEPFGDDFRTKLNCAMFSMSFRPYLSDKPDDWTGDTIIFAPDLGCDRSWFDTAFRYPALRNMTLLSFDWPGQGDTCSETGPKQLWRSAKDRFNGTVQYIYDMVEESLGTFHIVAHGMGAVPALAAWSALPRDRLGAFIAIEGNLTGPDCALASRRMVGGPAEVEACIAELSESDSTSDRIWASDMAWCDPEYIAAVAQGLVAACDSGHIADHWRWLQRPHYLYGAHSGYPEHHRALFDQTCTNTIEIPGAGHFPMLDNRSDTWAAVATAIKGTA